jgi:ferric-dicitrate binding protein FerR (iron transport regulator)
MDEIYTILAKHFLKETTEIEEKKVFNFRRSNPKEYDLLKKLWEKERFEIHEFNAEKAWNNFETTVINQKKYTIPFYWNFVKVAASIAFLIITVLSIFYINQTMSTIKVNNSSANPQLVNLEDGSQIWLNSNSSINYKKNFIDEFRSVELRGTAYFQVARDTLHPFVVTCENTSTTVLGTSFNISNENNKIMVTVKTGIVKVELQETANAVILTANQAAMATNLNLVTSKIIDKNYQSWMTGIFEFSNTPLTKVISDLNTFYKNIKLSTPDNDCFLTAKFENAKISEVIETLSATCNLEVEKINNKIILR